MKLTTYISALLIIILLGCKQQTKTSEVNTETVTEAITENQMRRFTYFFQSGAETLPEVFQSEAWHQLKSVSGILELNVYKKENDYFMVVDTDASFNAKILMATLKQSKVFSDFEANLSSLGVDFPKPESVLERIYKLDQKVVYTPEEGQLKTKIGAYKRFVWTLLLEEDPELMAEYKRVHGIGQAWPEITANMKSIGVKDMEIYLHGAQAILIMDTKPDFNLKEVAPKWQKLPREEEWQAYVAKFQRTKPNSTIQEKWLDMLPL